MKHLRNFPDIATRDAVLANIDYGVLSYTTGVGIKMKTEGSDELNITIKFFRGYKTPAAIYEYTFSPSTILADAVNAVFEDHPELSSGYNIYLADFEFEEVNPPYPLVSFSTLSDLGVTNRSILSFCENLS